MTKNLKQNILEIAGIVILMIVITSVLVMVCGASPLDAFALFIRGVFGTSASFAEVFVKACPLILTSLGCAVAFQTGFFNIGAEGQFYVGAMIGTIVALYVPVPGPVRIVLSLAAGFAAGGCYALLAAVLKAKWNISEIIVTIMLNYIAINFLGYAVRGFLKDPSGNVPQSERIPDAVQLKPLILSTRFHGGIILAIAMAFLVFFLMNHTTAGFEMKAVGANRRAAFVNGISVTRNIVLSAFLGGGLAAVAGVVEVLSVQKKLLEGISSGCGYTAVLIALIASDQPLGVLAAALLFAMVQTGVGSMQRQLGVPNAIVNILSGSVVIFLMICSVFRVYRQGRKEKRV